MITRDEKILSNLGLINKVMKNIEYRIPYQDVFQYGVIGLIKAVDTFDAGKGYKFSGFAYRCILNEISRQIDQNERLIRIPCVSAVEFRKIEFFKNNFLRENGKQPSITDVSKFTGFSENKIKRLQNISLISVDIENVILVADEPEEGFYYDEKELERLLNGLPRMPRIIMREKLSGLNNKEIAKKHDMKLYYISRHTKKAVKLMRGYRNGTIKLKKKCNVS